MDEQRVEGEAGAHAASQPFRQAGRPSRDEAQALSEAILDSAYDILCEEGFSNTTLALVAERARTVRRSVTRRYKDKDELLLAIIDRMGETGIRARLRGRTEAEDPLDDLNAVCRQLLSFVTDPNIVSFFRVILGECGRLPQIPRAMIEENDAVAQIIQGVIIKVQRTGRMQKLSAEAASQMIIGMLVSNPINRAMLGDPNFCTDHGVELYFSQIWSLLISIS